MEIEPITEYTYTENTRDKNLVGFESHQKSVLERKIRAITAEIIPITYIPTCTPGAEKIVIGQSPRYFMLSKLSGEWFYVYVSPGEYFKCDQFDSLLRCLARYIPIRMN